MLLCPKCKAVLQKEDHRYVCENHHSYDIAKRGYVHLAIGQHKSSGDDRKMVKSRTRFLSQGYYTPLLTALQELVEQRQPKRMIDAGCGEGYYTNHLKASCPQSEVIGFDLSKHAVDEACKKHLDITYAVANCFHMPLPDAYADMVLSIFAPFDAKEMYRVLQADGVFIKVGPAQQHLMGLKKVLYEQPYENELKTLAYEGFVREEERFVQADIVLQDQQSIQDVFHMTPYYWKTPRDAQARLAQITQLATPIHFHIEVFRKKACETGENLIFK